MKSSKLVVTLPEDVANRVREDASRCGVSVSQWIQDAIRRHMADAHEREALKRYRDEAAREALRQFEAEFGKLSEAAVLERTAAWPG